MILISGNYYEQTIVDYFIERWYWEKRGRHITMMRDQERCPKGTGARVKSEVQAWIGQKNLDVEWLSWAKFTAALAILEDWFYINNIKTFNEVSVQEVSPIHFNRFPNPSCLENPTDVFFQPRSRLPFNIYSYFYLHSVYTHLSLPKSWQGIEKLKLWFTSSFSPQFKAPRW